MGILEAATAAQAELERIAAETGVPADNLQLSIVGPSVNMPDACRMYIDLSYPQAPQWRAVYHRLVKLDGELDWLPADTSEYDRFYDACRARAAELTPPQPPPFDADDAIFNSDAFVPLDDVKMIGTNGALVVGKDTAKIVRRRRGGHVDDVTGLDRLINPRPVPPEHSVCVVFPNGVYVAEPDDLTVLPRTYFVCTSDKTHEIANWDDAIQTAVALARETQP